MHLDKDAKQALRVQPIGGSSLFGPSVPAVAKAYGEDLTRRSLQRVTTVNPTSSKSSSLGKKVAKKKRPSHAASSRVVSAGPNSNPVVSVPNPSKPFKSWKKKKARSGKAQQK